jgi:hypothetical protein
MAIVYAFTDPNRLSGRPACLGKVQDVKLGENENENDFIVFLQ